MCDFSGEGGYCVCVCVVLYVRVYLLMHLCVCVVVYMCVYIRMPMFVVDVCSWEIGILCLCVNACKWCVCVDIRILPSRSDTFDSLRLFSKVLEYFKLSSAFSN